MACTSEVIHKSLGNVNLLLKRWKNCTKRRSGTRDYEYNKDSEPTIHEDSKKAQVSHAISCVPLYLAILTALATAYATDV